MMIPALDLLRRLATVLSAACAVDNGIGLSPSLRATCRASELLGKSSGSAR